jgi:hypothetical protein
MIRPNKFSKTQISKYILLSLGIGAVLVSVLYASAYLAILGIAIIFSDSLLFYLTPTKHIPLIYLDTLANGCQNNVERILSEFDLSEKGIYLPPKNLNSFDSSLIFIPNGPKSSLPGPGEINGRILSKNKNGVFLTPIGLGLVQLFEKELGMSLTKTNLKDLQITLPKVMIEYLQLAEKVEIVPEKDKITINIVGSLLGGVCQQTNILPNTHTQIGCMLSSALACALAKSTGKPIIIQKEVTKKETKTTSIDFLLLDN